MERDDGYEPGDVYDCPACGGTHEVREGKGLRVAGAGDALDPSPYVRCPEAGVVSLSGAGTGERADADSDGTGSPDEDDADTDDWP